MQDAQLSYRSTSHDREADLLSDYPYCLIPNHYFESPRTISVTFEKININNKVNIVVATKSQSKMKTALGTLDLALTQPSYQRS